MKTHWLVAAWIPFFVLTLALRLGVLLFPCIPGGHPAALEPVRDQALQAYLLLHEEAPPALSAGERAHLADVRHWLGLAWAVLALSGLGLLGSAVRASPRPGRREALAEALRAGSLLTLLLLLLLAIAAFMDFRGSFRAMHHVLFPADSWFFDDGTWLVERFPADFWRNAAGVFLGIALLLTVGIALGSRALSGEPATRSRTPHAPGASLPDRPRGK